MFTKVHLEQHIHASHLQGAQDYRKIPLSLSSVIIIINQNGRWTVYRWGNEVSLMTQAS